MAAWPNLLLASVAASRGRRGRSTVAAFEFQRADALLRLQGELLQGQWRHGPYVHFQIHEPKRRTISAAAFRDRIVHHALCQELEPRFERLFIADSYANRVGKGTHRALARAEEFCRNFRYVLRMDVRQHFPSVDHAILRQALARQVMEDDVMALVNNILDSAHSDAAPTDSAPAYFPGDDLFAACRPRGLPIGNLTSQFWSNVVLHALDVFVKRELRCAAYLRYVDDFALFANDKATLWRWKVAIIERLARLRLHVHEASAQALPTSSGMPWLGFVVYPYGVRVKARKVRYATQRLGRLYEEMQTGRISFAQFDASVQGWINHVRYGDVGEGLRRHVLQPFVLPPGCRPQRRE